MLRILPLLLCGAVLFGCQNNPGQSDTPTSESTEESGPNLKVVADTSVQSTVREYVATFWCGDGLSGAAVAQASDIYRYENCEEVQETLEITDVRNAGEVTAAFLRYSIGTKVFREALWFRQVEERYALSRDRPTTYSDEDDWSRAALELAEEADKWEEESATWHE